MMIIECPKCGTKFKFDEKNFSAEGIWARCCRCQNVFFQENPFFSSDLKKAAESSIALEQEGKDPLGDYDGNAVREPLDEESDESFDEPEAPRPRRTMRNYWTPGKVTAYVAILIFVLGGVAILVFPEVKSSLPFAKYLGFQTAVDLSGGGIDLLNVRERFLENRNFGSLMVIQGFAVNRNKYPVSKIKVRAKLLNTAGEFTGESEAYCGVLLTEEELLNLTEREIRSELNNPYGRNITNADIPPDGNIPFVIIFLEPPSKTIEYIVELAELEKPIR